MKVVPRPKSILTVDAHKPPKPVAPKIMLEKIVTEMY